MLHVNMLVARRTRVSLVLLEMYSLQFCQMCAFRSGKSAPESMSVLCASFIPVLSGVRNGSSPQEAYLIACLVQKAPLLEGIGCSQLYAFPKGAGMIVAASLLCAHRDRDQGGEQIGLSYVY